MATQKKTTPKGRRKDAYTSKEITVLEGLDPVRKRPGMYIGSTGETGLHHLVWEVVDNAIDEAMAGHGTLVRVTLLPGNRVRIEDDGRGIPVDIHKQTKKSALETVLTTLHAGGKFGEGGGYKVSGGLHGVGVSVVNALSTYLRAEVTRDGKAYAQEYKRGKPTGKVKPTGKATGSGTTIIFEPDAEIFSTVEFDWSTIIDRLRQHAYLTKGVRIEAFDERDPNKPRSYVFYFEGGLASFVRHLNHGKKAKQADIFHVDKELDDVKVEVALQYTDEIKESVFSFANNILNPGGGTHMVGFRTALTRTINSFARRKGYLKEKDENLTGDDVREGLTAVISVKLPDPQFEGQTKDKLGNPEIRNVVDQVFAESFDIFLEEHPKETEAIIGKALLASRARIAAKAARESVLRKGALEGLTLPGKLADCSSREAEKCELYIVEGDSAGGSAKQGRDRNFQAILPLRGKILNVERARLDKMLANNEIKSLVIALGTNIGEQFDIQSLRYGRIIIMTDADVDGAHIRTLLLTLFYRYFPELIRQGHLYIAQPPLYRVQQGKKSEYVYNEEALESIKKAWGVKAEDLIIDKDAGDADGESDEAEDNEGDARPATGKKAPAKAAKVNIQRYKGLGEMNPEQLWETTMNPETRVMLKVDIEDAAKADEMFDILMGSDVSPRKRFIQTHAKSVKNLDI